MAYPPKSIRIGYRREGVFEDKTVIDKIASDRGLHPGVGHHDPEGRQRTAKGDHTGGKEMHTRRDLLPAEGHYSNKGGFKHKGHRGLKTKQMPEDIAAGPGKLAPVGAELKFHGDAADDPHCEIE